MDTPLFKSNTNICLFKFGNKFKILQMRTFILANIFRQEPVLFSFQYLFKITNIDLVEKISWSKLVYHCWIKINCCFARNGWFTIRRNWSNWKCNSILLCKQFILFRRIILIVETHRCGFSIFHRFMGRYMYFPCMDYQVYTSTQILFYDLLRT